jgi:glycosyltransferase involved in cell wall biosynthesis
MRLVCVLYGGPEHPSSRLRVLQHLGALRERGFEPEIFVAKRNRLAQRAALARRARRADAVLIQRKLFPRWMTPLLLDGAPLFFDMDDAYFAVSPYERERFGERRAARRAAARARRLEAILRRCRGVIAGNRFLADYAARHARTVWVLPTAVDLAPFPDAAVRAARERRRAAGDGPRLGWIGSRPSLHYLKSIAGPLREICGRHPGARLVQICDAFVDLPGVPSETIPWSAGREADDLLSLDVGLMPLEDTPFARGKCGLKILQYYAAALPVVCSPVGANLEIVADGETGYLARDAAEWTGALERVLSDPERSRALGEAGRRRVQERYAASRLGAELAALLGAALA